MASPNLHIRRTSHERLEVRFSGTLEEADALECERELRALLRHSESENLGVLVCLLDMVEYSLPARDVLVRVQTFLSTKASGTAYVADTAERRALALWVRHLADARSIAVYENVGLAERFLDGEHGAVSAMRPCGPETPIEIDDDSGSAVG